MFCFLKYHCSFYSFNLYLSVLTHWLLCTLCFTIKHFILYLAYFREKYLNEKFVGVRKREHLCVTPCDVYIHVSSWQVLAVWDLTFCAGHTFDIYHYLIYHTFLKYSSAFLKWKYFIFFNFRFPVLDEFTSLGMSWIRIFYF